MKVNRDFSERAVDAFRYLIDDFQFSLAEQGRNAVCFASDRVSVLVTFDALRSHEFGVVFNEKEGAQPGYELGEVLAATECPNADRFSLVQTSDPEVQDRFLSDASEALKRWGERVIAGDPDFFEMLKLRRNEAAEAYTESLTLKPILAQAATAWSQKNYREVVRLLEPVENKLETSSQRRLAFAKSRLSSG